jgi:hypothetical protein
MNPKLLTAQPLHLGWGVLAAPVLLGMRRFQASMGRITVIGAAAGRQRNGQSALWGFLHDDQEAALAQALVNAFDLRIEELHEGR